MNLLKKKSSADTDQPTRRSNQTRHERPTSEDLSNRYAFRRNRTITGSSSGKIISSNELNAEVKSPRAHVHHLTSLRRRLLFYFSVVGIAAFGLYLIVSQLVAATAVQVAGVSSVPATVLEEYDNSIELYYQSRPAERLRFVLNEPALLSHVQSLHPEVRDLRIEPGGTFGEATATVIARAPIARWSLSGGDQFVDEDGVVFARNYFSTPSLEIVDNSGIQVGSARLVASNRFLGFVGKVIARSTDNGLSVDKVTIPAFTTRQVVVTLKGNETGYKLSVDRSAGEQVEDIARIVNYLASRNIKPGYVDVRLSGKAYYK